MVRRIAVANQKGGCGKTTTSVNLAACLSRLERRVLLVDMDPQGHATLGLGIDPEKLEKTTYEVLTRNVEMLLPVQDVRIQVDPRLDILPANILLSALEQELAGKEGREDRLLKAVQSVGGDYDYIIVDCPPSLGLLTFNALRACHEILVPTEASHFSQHGVRRLSELVSLLRERYQQDLILYGLITNFDSRSAFARMILEEQRESFPGVFLDIVIHVSSKIREATFCGQPVVEYARYSRSAKEFRQLAEEIITREQQAALLSLHEAIPQKAYEPSAEQEEILFRVRAPRARQVFIVGSFNQWKSGELPLRGPDEDGYWYASVILPQGAHQYKFVVDGTWTVDPENPLKDEDGFGGINSVVEI